MQSRGREIGALEDRATRAESTLKHFLDSSREATLIHRESLIEYVNPAFCALTGYAAEELVGADSLLLPHPDDLSTLAETRERSYSREDAPPVRVRWRKKDGSFIWIEGTRTLVEHLGAPAVIVRARDVTHEIESAARHEQTELSLRVTDERYRILFERSPLAIWIFDPTTLAFLVVNDTTTALYGYSHEEFSRLKISDLRLPGHFDELVRDVADAQTLTNSTWRGTKTHRKKDGSNFQMEITAHMVTFDGRKAMLAMGRDVTELARMELQLRQSQKMDAIGQLAGGIAHDFNNILAVILAVADMMLLDLEVGHPLTDDVREIESAARRASALTHQLLAFSRQPPARPKHVLLSEVVSQMEKMLTRMVREDITMTLDLASSGIIYADPSHLEQVLLNLVVNARDAMPDGGRLVIKTEDIDLVDPRAASLGVKPGRYQQLSVSDTGCGMAPSVQSRIFDPFFTTKELGKGTGLGLTTVFGIVKQGSGGIAVDSSPGRGTTLTIVFPQVHASADVISPRTNPPAQSAGSETILLVEDDETVRRVVSRVLRSNGYRVLEASDGNEALAQVNRDGPVDILVSDLVMPHMDGRALGREIASKFPKIKMLYMSGHELAAVGGTDPLIVEESFISKPFTPTEMLSAIRGLLEASP